MNRLRKRRLGKTGLEVTELGFGGISIQSVAADEAAALVAVAAEAGINFFDTARVYTDSERKIGEGLRSRKAAGEENPCMVATKSLALMADGVRGELETSLAELGMDSVELFQLHNVSRPETLERVLAKDGALAGAARAREEGLCSHVGVTSHNVDVAAAAIRTGMFETLQIPYNIVEDAAATKGVFALARQLDVGVIIMKPLAGGALADAGTALRFALHPLAASVIPGMRSEGHLRADIAAMSLGPLEEGELARLRGEAARLGERFCRRCQYCLPCPEDIDIPQVFICATTATARGESTRAQRMYSLLRVPASACADCGDCEPRCPYELPIRDMLREAVQTLDGG